MELARPVGDFMNAKRTARSPAVIGLRLGGTLLCIIGLLAVLVAGYRLVHEHRQAHRGIVYGEPPNIPAQPAFLGVNVALEQYSDSAGLAQALATIRAGGFAWVRQLFPWAEIEPAPGDYRWESWDRLVAAARAYDLGVVAVLTRAPAWARASEDADNPYGPPADPADFARFVSAFVTHYRGQIRYVQLWDEPNIAPHWGNRPVDPEGYVALLRAGYEAATSADPEVVVLAAGLAPTTEVSERNLNDVLFLREMYGAGARGFFDILAIKPYGFWSGPDDRRASPDVLNFSRAVLLREEMLQAGDKDTPVWAVEFGWNALPRGWTGRPSPWGTDEPALQARRTTEAVRRARDEWPWLQVMLVQHFQPAVPPDDPLHGFALVDEGGTPRPAYLALQQLTVAPPEATPGRHLAGSETATYLDGWERRGQGWGSTGAGAQVRLRFRGSRVDALSPTGGRVQVQVDNEAPREISLAADRATTLVGGLPFASHTLTLTAQAEGAEIAGWVVVREAQFGGFYLRLGLLAVGILLLLVAGMWLARPLPWGTWWQRLARGYDGLPEPAQLAALAGTALAFYLAPGLPLSLVLLLPLLVLIYLRLDLGLAVLVFSVPFFLRPKPLAGKAFSLVEILTLLCVAAWGLRHVVARSNDFSRFELLGPELRTLLRRMQSLDWAVGLLLAASLISPLVAELRGVALRELRVVVLEPVALYVMLRTISLDKRRAFRLVDALVFAGVALSLHGLYQYAFTDQTILAEGVRRVRGLYPSPNNLSLFLDRIPPLTVAVAAFGAGSRRRWAYALATVPILAALFLTFSRAAWLVGLPAGLLFLGLTRGRRAAVVTGLAVVVGLLALLPFAQAERIASLFNLTSGTTFLRLKLWQASLNMIRDHPWLGVGLDNFLYQYRDHYVLPEALIERNLSHPHNFILDFWTRLGVPGVLAIFWISGAALTRGWRAGCQLVDADLRALTLGLTGSLIAALAHGLLDNSYFLVDLAFVFMLTLGLIQWLAGRAAGRRIIWLPFCRLR